MRCGRAGRRGRDRVRDRDDSARRLREDARRVGRGWSRSTSGTGRSTASRCRPGSRSSSRVPRSTSCSPSSRTGACTWWESTDCARSWTGRRPAPSPNGPGFRSGDELKLRCRARRSSRGSRQCRRSSPLPSTERRIEVDVVDADDRRQRAGHRPRRDRRRRSDTGTILRSAWTRARPARAPGRDRAASSRGGPPSGTVFRQVIGCSKRPVERSRAGRTGCASCASALVRRSRSWSSAAARR